MVTIGIAVGAIPRFSTVFELSCIFVAIGIDCRARTRRDAICPLPNIFITIGRGIGALTRLEVILERADVFVANLILQFLDAKGAYNVLENHGPALLGEGKSFSAEAQKDVFDSYAQFILQFFTEENQMKEAFSIHRSVQMGEHWLTHRAYKDLQRRRKMLEAMYVKSQVPFPGLLPLSLLEKDGYTKILQKVLNK